MEPVFKELQKRSDDWVRQLVTLPSHPGIDQAELGVLDLTYEDGHWWPKEHPLAPPRRLLEWLVTNPTALRQPSSSHPDRAALLRGDKAKLRQALAEIEVQPDGRGWHLLEGTTFPDATIITTDAVIVVEGKRTEAGPTVDTSWLAGRHQIWRHIEGAWGIRGSRQVFGFFLVEEVAGEIPPLWVDAAREAVTESALSTSFPHLRKEEREALAACFLGVATWQQVCRSFDIDIALLPDTVDDLPSKE